MCVGTNSTAQVGGVQDIMIKKKFANEEPPNCGGVELSIVKTGSTLYTGCCDCTAGLQHVSDKLGDGNKVSIPPWKINLVSLSDECKFESIPILNDSGTSNIDTIEGLKCVR